MKFAYPAGATPLDPDEAVGLIPTHITTQKQLNEWEYANILDAENWVFSRKWSNILSIGFSRKLHQKMFDKTWRWAGQFRRTNKNIGVLWEQVSTQLKLLLDDIHFQIEEQTYPFEEIMVRFHHRLVLVHPFPNGNGRHARLMTNLLLFYYGHTLFTWGRNELIENNQARKNYIEALKKADRGDYSALQQFVRS